MFVSPVAGIDDRHVGVVGCDPHRPFTGMADDNYIGIVLQHPHCVGDRFALGGRGRLGIGRRQDLPPEAIHRRLEREPCAGAGFIEQGCQDAALRLRLRPAHPVGNLGIGEVLQELVRQPENRLDFSLVQVINRDQMANHERGRNGKIGVSRGSTRRWWQSTEIAPLSHPPLRGEPNGHTETRNETSPNSVRPSCGHSPDSQCSNCRCT